jgi:hypothetical protein
MPATITVRSLFNVRLSGLTLPRRSGLPQRWNGTSTVATGAAVGAGMVAEERAHCLTEGHHDAAANSFGQPRFSAEGTAVP